MPQVPARFAGLTCAAGLLNTSDASSSDSPLHQIFSARAAADCGAGACRRWYGNSRRYCQRNGTSGIAAGHRGISTQAQGISGGTRRVRDGGKRVLELDLGKASGPQRKAPRPFRRDHLAVTLDDYVLTQPPRYSGPSKPVDPAPPEKLEAPRERKAIPVVADLLRAAADHFQFAPQRPANEIEFKRAYARTASAAGLTQDQAVRVYSFETGGNGNHDMQSGLSASRPGSRATPPAIGYNQLLTTHSVALVAEQG